MQKYVWRTDGDADNVVVWGNVILFPVAFVFWKPYTVDGRKVADLQLNVESLLLMMISVRSSLRKACGGEYPLTSGCIL